MMLRMMPSDQHLSTDPETDPGCIPPIFMSLEMTLESPGENHIRGGGG